MSLKGRARKLKAQSMIFEQGLIFVIAIIIFIMCFAIFSSYQDYYNSLSITDGVYQVRNVLASAVLKVLEKPMGAEATITVPIPRRVGDQPYKVYFMEGDDGKPRLFVELPSTEETVISNLGGMSELLEFTFSENRVFSDKGKVIIYKKGNEIKLI